MKNMLKSKLFWIFSALFAIGIFLVAINSNRTYQSSMDVLFLPKNEITTRNIAQVIANAKQIPKSLSFYDKLLENNADIEDGAAELPDAKRKDFWNSEIGVEQIGKSGAVRVTIFGADQMQTEITSRETAVGLITVMSRYYDIKVDLDMRIIDGPITKEIVRLNMLMWIFLSLCLGVIFGYIVSFLTNLIVEKVASIATNPKIELEEKSSMFANFSFPKMELSRREELPAEIEGVFDFNIEKEKEIVSSIQEVPAVSFEKKAAAPANLPIAEEEDGAFEAPDKNEIAEPIVAEEVAIADVAPIDVTREATPEEVKDRLNKLLSGGIFK
ncbi:MAG: hypothetical protein UT50_C0001G0008 [Candidatus Moranbacteria bacterium GW2011_GWA2_39_41]|nr:MAG: hypothetical protein UT50_C0001G0008 [Candidatus Moranbacteria bacterium GW2011_GWA2_39_41]